jgi:hypothetical protein
VLTVQRAGTEPAVLAWSVQSQELPDGTCLVTVALVPMVFLAAFWTVSINTMFTGPATEAVAIVLAPDTLHRVFVGMIPPISGVSVTT